MDDELMPIQIIVCPQVSCSPLPALEYYPVEMARCFEIVYWYRKVEWIWIRMHF
jgi:hypothetical protein